MKGKKLASAAAALCLTLLLAPVVAFAPQEAHAAGTQVGDFAVEGGAGGADYDYSDHVLTIKTNTPLTISGSTTTDRIVVKKDVSANITLAGVSIYVTGLGCDSPLQIEANTEGEVVVTLADNTTNVLIVEEEGSLTAPAGLEKAGTNGSLKIQCEHSAEGGHVCANTCGKLQVASSRGAGIGSSENADRSADAGNITIAGGAVTANSEKGAGIGSGSANGEESGGVSNITITGGIVTASSKWGSGIGAGYASSTFGSVSDIAIAGGSVKASSVGALPTDGNGNAVYLCAIPNPNGRVVYIDGKEYQTVSHTAADSSDTTLYAYLTGKQHVVSVGGTEATYDFNDNVFSCSYTKQCSDDNKDHKCDTCGYVLSTCTYEWQDEDGQYWQECSVCGHETAKEDIPSITINGADEVCRTQDYSFSFTLPQGTTLVGACYYPGESEQPISLLQSEGVYSGVVLAKDHTPFPAASNFEVRVKAETSDGYEFTVTKTVTSRSEHAYEWQDEDGQYWQECSVCGHETAKEDIPSITITGADAVCRTQDYSFSVLLPEGVTVTSWSYEFEGKGDGFLVPEGKMGVFSATVPASVYEDEGSFKVTVTAKTSDGFVFSFDKIVALQSEHAGGTANCMHKAVCSTCGGEYGELGAHSLTHVAAKEAMADVEGNIEYWRCETCGKLFSDAQGKSEITLADTVVKKLQKSDAPEKTAKTGDSVNVAFWLTLLSVASVALAVACIRNVRGRVR